MLKSTHGDNLIQREKDRIIWDNLVDLANEHDLYRPIDVARKTGVSAQQLGDIQRGLKGFGPKNIRRICESFGVTEEWLLTTHNTDKKELNMDELERWKKLAETLERQVERLERENERLRAENPQRRPAEKKAK